MPEFSREIYTFVEIAREGSIRRAAEKLNISSSALSRQMRLLETDFGASLIERSVTGVQLTDAGRVLLRQAELWLAESNRLRAELGTSGRPDGKVLRLGAMECFAGNLLPELFQYARRIEAADRIDFRSGGTDDLLQSLREGHLDFLIAFNVQNSQAIRVISEATSRIGMVYRPGLCDLAGPEVALAQALEWPICLPDQSLSVHSRLYAEILKQRRTPDIRGGSNSIEFIRDLVLRGECASFLNWFDVCDEVRAGRLRFVPLAEKRLSERVCICVSGARPYTAQLSKLASEAVRILDSRAGPVVPIDQ